MQDELYLSGWEIEEISKILTKYEDGYSLSGEAKDATASRNGLSRNQMGIEEKAAECKEAATVLANGNAL